MRFIIMHRDFVVVVAFLQNWSATFCYVVDRFCHSQYVRRFCHFTICEEVLSFHNMWDWYTVDFVCVCFPSQLDCHFVVVMLSIIGLFSIFLKTKRLEFQLVSHMCLSAGLQINVIEDVNRFVLPINDMSRAEVLGKLNNITKWVYLLESDFSTCIASSQCVRGCMHACINWLTNTKWNSLNQLGKSHVVYW